MKKYVLPCNGQAPVIFTGEIIAESLGKNFNVREETSTSQQRWHDLRIYRTEAGNYILEIEYHSAWDGEIPVQRFAQQGKPDEIIRMLSLYNCQTPVQGFPSLMQYEKRQAGLLKWITLMYQSQVKELLSGMEETFGERID